MGNLLQSTVLYIAVSPLRRLDYLLFNQEKPTSKSESIKALKEKELLELSEFPLWLVWQLPDLDIDRLGRRGAHIKH
jgi:hypothetical protein